MKNTFLAISGIAGLALLVFSMTPVEAARLQGAFANNTSKSAIGYNGTCESLQFGSRYSFQVTVPELNVVVQARTPDHTVPTLADCVELTRSQVCPLLPIFQSQNSILLTVVSTWWEIHGGAPNGATAVVNCAAR